MKICIIGKYPPIQGGVSSNNYWLSRSLADKGHKVFVVTNAEEVEPEYREEILPKDAAWLEPRNVKIFNTYPGHKVIPQYSAFIAKLASLAIDVVKAEKIDVIYSNYLLPYGVAANLVKQATGVPWYLDHAGSDITNIFEEPLFKTVLTELFKNADLVANTHQVWKKLVKTCIIKPEKLAPFLGKPYHIGLKCDKFLAKIKPFNLAPFFLKFDKRLPVFTFFGKISSLKKTLEFAEAAAYLPKGKFYLLFVTEKGFNLLRLRNLIKKAGLSDYTCFLSFQPPWKVPAIIAASTCVVAPESEEEPYLPGNTHRPGICFETMLCARCAVIGREMRKKPFYSGLQENKHFLTVDPEDRRGFARKLETVINEPSLAARIGRQARSFCATEIKHSLDNTDVFLKNLNVAILKSERKRHKVIF